MASHIIGTEKFRDYLEDWLFKNDQRAADFLYLNKASIPSQFRNYTRKLYRGMTVGNEFIENVSRGRYTFDKHTSWTKDINLAKKFANDPAFMINTVGDQKYQIVMSKVVSQKDMIIDIDGFVAFMGVKQLEVLGYDEMNIDSALKEKEVLVAKGVVVTRADYNIIS
jgi:hypothetical protein